MNKKILFLLIGLVSAGVVTAKDQFEAVPGEFLVKIKPRFSALQLSHRTLSAGIGVKSVLAKSNILVVKAGEEKDSVAREFRNEAEYIEPNYIYRISDFREEQPVEPTPEVSPDDPRFGDLWGMNNSGNAGVDISAPRAWAIHNDARDVVVAVIDTGIDTQHPDIQENLWVNEAELNGEPGVDDDGNGYVDDIHGYDFVNNSGLLIDDNGHGTHVAGTIGARGANGIGVVGVVWSVQLMGLKFLSARGGGSASDAIRAIDYATAMGATISNNSWGGGPFSQALFDAIERNRDAGALFVAAAGNSRQDNDRRPTYPASYNLDNIVSVAAIDRRGSMASFSSYGATSVHVGAPGVDILSTMDQGYRSISGTSMAAPHVAGLAALLASYFPGSTYDFLKTRMMESAKPLRSLEGRVASGLIDAYAALTYTPPEPEPQDPENPDDWMQRQVDISTPNPYPDNHEQVHQITQPGARKMRVYFEYFQTERTYDFLDIHDQNGNLVAEMSGGYGQGFWSPVIEGEMAVLTFSSDDSIGDLGFRISRVAYLE